MQILKIFLSISILFSSLFKISAQEVKGKLLDSGNSQLVPDVTVIYHENGRMSYFSKDGTFEFQIQKFPIKMTFLAAGYEKKTLKIQKEQKNIVVFLDPTENILREIVIRSTIIPQKLQKIPAAVNLISKKDFQRTDHVNLVENLNTVPGVYVNQGAVNTNKINIRGIGARSQYSTNRIKAYFDGIPLTTAEGSLTLDDFDPETLERIEIIKGPTSSIYGAGLGGAIHLFSARPEKLGNQVKFGTQYGSYNTTKTSLSGSYNASNFGLYANISQLESNGYRENGEYDRKSAFIIAKLDQKLIGKVSFLAHFTRLKAFIPSSLNENDFKNNPERAATNWAEAKGFESYDRGLFGISNKHEFTRNFSNETGIYLKFREAYEPRPFDILEERNLAAGARTKFQLKTSFLDIPINLGFGAEFYREWYETGTYENLYEDFPGQGSVLGNQLRRNDQNRNYANIFSQANLQFSQKWAFEIGFNFNSTNYALEDLFPKDGINQSGKYGFDPVFSPRIASIYEFAEGKMLYASISHGFSTPTVAETLTPEGIINTNLKPETGMNYEFGFKTNWLENNLYVELVFYSIQIKNLLLAKRIAEDQYYGINAGKTNHNGMEFLTKYNFKIAKNIAFKPYFNASLNSFKFEDFENTGMDYAGNSLPGVPEFTINTGVDIISKGLSFYINYRTVGEIPLNDANSIYSKKYDLVNLKTSYEIALFGSSALEIFFGVNNLFEEHYAASILTNAVGFGGAAPRYYYPGNSRNFFGGMNFNFNF